MYANKVMNFLINRKSSWKFYNSLKVISTISRRNFSVKQKSNKSITNLLSILSENPIVFVNTLEQSYENSEEFVETLWELNKNKSYKEVKLMYEALSSAGELHSFVNNPAAKYAAMMAYSGLGRPARVVKLATSITEPNETRTVATLLIAAHCYSDR